MFIYVIGGSEDRHKIGFARDCERRLSEFNTAHYEALRLKFSLEVSEDLHRAVERRAHILLADNRMRGEWFSITEGSAIAAVQEALRQVVDGEPEPDRSNGPPEPDPQDLRGVRMRLGWLWRKGRPLHYEELGEAFGFEPADASAMIRGLEAEFSAGREGVTGPLLVLVQLFLAGHLPPGGVPRASTARAA